MEMYLWSTVIVLSKFMFYFGFACVASYTFLGDVFDQDPQKQRLESVNYPDFKLVTLPIVLAFISNIVCFFANTGAMAEEGLQGALDADMLEIMWDSSIGDVTLFRSVGLVIAIFALLFSVYIKANNLKRNLTRVFFTFSLIVLMYSFSMLGHVSELGVVEKLALILHVFLMAWWIGSLLPLRKACDFLAYEELYIVMDKFGKQASVVVSLLLVAGLWLAIQLVGSVEELLNSNYGQVLLVKLFLVILMVSVAALHKLKLVPALKSQSGQEVLSQSLWVETILAFAILAVTATLTSVVGPSV